MTKKQIKKEAYKKIVKEGMSHQELYESLKTPKPSFNLTIAELISKVPSKDSFMANKNWRMIYLILMAFVILIRVLGLIGLSQYSSINNTILLFGLIIALLIPGLGIFAILTRRMDTLRGTSILFIFAVFRSFRNAEFNEEDLIWAIPMLGVVILGFWLPKKMETKFTKTVINTGVGGEKIIDYKIQFVKEKSLENDDVLDL